MRQWFRFLRPSSRASRRQHRPAWRRPTFRPNLDVLEDRCLLAAAVIDPISVPLNVPVGKTLIVPVTGSDPTTGGTVSITMTPSAGSSGIQVTPLTGTFLQFNVTHTASSTAGDTSFTGTMEFELFGTVTPQTVAYITGLVEAGFYNSLTFHRVVAPSSTSTLAIIQGGDPNGNGSGGPPAGGTTAQMQQLQFPDEFSTDAIFSGTGQLAMANAGNDTNGSQFFVTNAPQRFLDFNHTIFGQLVRGFNILADIESVPVDSNSKPLSPVTITSAQIVPDPNAAVFLIQSTGTTTGTASVDVTATPSTAGDTATTQTQTVNIVADTTNDPPILNVSQAPLNFGQAPNANPVQNLTTAVNTPVTVNLSSTDLEGNTPTYTITEATGEANATVSPSNSTGQFTITPKAGFTGLLHFTAKVTETGSTRNNGPDSQIFTVAVGDQPITATASTSLTATSGTSATPTLATFTDPDTTAPASSFQVAINWGDGTALDTTSGSVTGSNGQFSVAGTHTYAHAGTYQAQVTVTDVRTQSTTTTTVPSTVPANQQYVNKLFSDLIGSPPTADQLNKFSGMLDKGQSRTTVVNDILALPAYKTHQVQQVYLNMFGTGPTSDQLKAGLQVINTKDVGALRVQLLSSDQFFKTVGGGTNAGYLAALGRELLHGSIDTATLTRLNNELTSGASRLSVLQDLVKTDKVQIDQQGVDNLYQTYLQRVPTSAEMTSALAITNKKRELDVTRLLTTSTEYFNKFVQTTTTTTTTTGDNGGAMAQVSPSVTVS
jgi:cyclophilin family peptidyl-prolyl cis-trans isomerase